MAISLMQYLNGQLFNRSYVWVVISDPREKKGEVVSVRLKLSDAYEDAKAYILRNNKDFDFAGRENWPARKFCDVFISMWLDSPSILKKRIS